MSQISKEQVDDRQLASYRGSLQRGQRGEPEPGPESDDRQGHRDIVEDPAEEVECDNSEPEQVEGEGL